MNHLLKKKYNLLFLAVLQENVTGFAGNSIVLLIAIIVILGLILLTIKINNDRKKTNILLRKQQSEVDGMRRKLSEGFGYAERIQTAILPPADKMTEILGQYFMVYQAKQQVSGDFYWVEQRTHKKMFAVIDCTGHGIPGALMSIIAYEGLNRAIIDYELTRTDKIVSALNEYLTETLKLTGSIDVKDAMNASLCMYNPDKSILEYTGARSPLHIVRQSRKSVILNDEEMSPVLDTGEASLYEIKPDRKSVEPTEISQEFTNNRIKVEKGDLIYLCSDGLPDQFGGDENKKFGYKRLRETLLSLKSLTMREQKKKMEQVINRWKGTQEQVDDISLLGVRF